MKKLVILFLLLLISTNAWADKKFTAEQTFTDEQVIGFAEFIGWTKEVTNPEYKWISPTVTEYSEDGIANEVPNPDYVEIPKMIPNPIKAEEFVKEKFIEHAKKFTTQWAEYLVEQEVSKAVYKARAETEAIAKPQILDPIANGFTMTVEEVE